MQHTLDLVSQHAVLEPIVPLVDTQKGREIHYFTHNFVLAIHFCQLLRNFLRSIWAIVIDHNDLPFKLTMQIRVIFAL